MHSSGAHECLNLSVFPSLQTIPLLPFIWQLLGRTGGAGLVQVQPGKSHAETEQAQGNIVTVLGACSTLHGHT